MIIVTAAGRCRGAKVGHDAERRSPRSIGLMMRPRYFRATAGVLAMTAAALVGFAGSATAGEPPPSEWDHRWTDRGVAVYVREYGDRISVCDTAADGSNAYVQVSWGSDADGYSFYTSGGKGDCRSSSQNIPEGVWVGIRYAGSGPIKPAEFKNDH
ncbi:hypothetical protein [Pseudonocardia sp. DLS-67]